MPGVKSTCKDYWRQLLAEAALNYYIKMKFGRKWCKDDVDSFYEKIESLQLGAEFTVKDLFSDWEDLNSSSQKTLGKKLSK